MTSRLEHRSGGKILSINQVAHQVFGRGRNAMTTWFFKGAIAWDDGSFSRETDILPSQIVIDGNDPIAKAQFDTLMEKLNQYLRENGQWDALGWWRPRANSGSEPVTFPEPEL
jgi:hypothetical protein